MGNIEDQIKILARFRENALSALNTAPGVELARSKVTEIFTQAQALLTDPQSQLDLEIISVPEVLNLSSKKERTVEEEEHRKAFIREIIKEYARELFAMGLSQKQIDKAIQTGVLPRQNGNDWPNLKLTEITPRILGGEMKPENWCVLPAKVSKLKLELESAQLRIGKNNVVTTGASEIITLVPQTSLSGRYVGLPNTPRYIL